MSLQLAAQHLASRGRGPDTELVHMAPSEVAGLHALARAHGGELTTNPETGLPEAGFLSKLLPSLIGAGLTFFSGGALSPLMAAGIVGGGTTLATGSLQKGLMAGLGAYGGAGLGAGVVNAGTGALSSAAGTAAANAVTPVAAEAAVPAALETAATAAPEYASFAPTQNAFGAFGEAPVAPAAPISVDAAAQAPVLSQSAADIGNTYAQEQAAQNAVAQKLATATPMETASAGLGQIASNPSQYLTAQNAKYGLAALSPAMARTPQALPELKGSGPNPYRYRFERGEANPFPTPSPTGIGQLYFPNAKYVAYAEGGSVEAMSDANAIGSNTGYPMADIHHGAYASPFQQPISSNVVSGADDTAVDPYTGEERLAAGGLSHLGDYSDGGRLLKGPGDGVSDDIPATIADKRPARLADGEFVVPARIVSELGNGSTDAGARKLYAMMDRVQKARSKTVGKDRVAVDSKAARLLPV